MTALEEINENIKAVFKEYFKEIRIKYKLGNTTEMSFRTPFENFISKLMDEVNIIEEPSKTKDIGSPDYRIFKKGKKIGYIETKDLFINLDQELDSNQINRYKNSINNIILTNYRRFILISYKSHQDVTLFNIENLEKSNYKFNIETEKNLLKLFNVFLISGPLITITSAEELAIELSKRGKVLKELTKEQLEEDVILVKKGELTSSVYDFYLGIKELIKDINIDDCSDAYSQTIIFGLFLAKINHQTAELNRAEAAAYIPANIAIIRKVFLNISDSLPSKLGWIVDEIIDVLNFSNVSDLLLEIGETTSTKKLAFLYFYENFLGLFDPKKRKQKGVYYTPRPVVSFITNSVNQVIKLVFQKPMGFGDDDVTVLDPAVGTGTFLRLVYLLTLLELKSKGLSGFINKKIENHILKDFYGFELLITPYIISHLNLTYFLKKWYYNFKNTDRVQIYLTNTLEPQESFTLMPFFKEINEETKQANEIKKRKKILAVIGNPPYSATSVNKGKWINDLIKKSYKTDSGEIYPSYYEVDGSPLGEKKVWLSDDYVKFLRFAQWKIDCSGEGIIGYITNHAYLDNPTFRGMRRSLLESFNRIYVINLHGNSLKRDKSPDGSIDENVFDIQQGVAISIFVKNTKLNDKKIYYYDLYGNRDFKYAWLDNNDILTVKWKELKPVSPFYFFIPKDLEMKAEYDSFWKLTDIFPINSVGIVTGRDKLTINFNLDNLWDTINEFIKLEPEIAMTKFNLGKDARDWKIEKAQQDIKNSGVKKELITRILYRPFDFRYTYYTGNSRGFIVYPLDEVMSNMFKDNIGLIFNRREELPVPYSHFLVTNKITEHCCLSIKTTCSLAPLYIYKEKDGTFQKIPNINPKLSGYLSNIYKKDVSPEEILSYIYAVVYSTRYRTKYAELLRDDFPRIPFIENIELFSKLSDLGNELISLHLLKNKLYSDIKFDIAGDNKISLIKYHDNKIFINNIQYFDGINEETWNFYIGGYKVLEKYLKSRKGRQLEIEELEHFIQIIEIIKKTIEIKTRIDAELNSKL